MTSKNEPIKLHTPRSIEEFDRIAEQFSASMSDIFDFELSEKKHNKLREMTARALGYPHGFQQIKAYINSVSAPTRGNDADSVTPFPEWPPIMVMFIPYCTNREYIAPSMSGLSVDLDGDILGEYELTDRDFVRVGKKGVIDLSDTATVLNTLSDHYRVSRSYARNPPDGKTKDLLYNNFVNHLAERYSLEVTPYFSHRINDRSETPADPVFGSSIVLELIRKPHPEGVFNDYAPIVRFEGIDSMRVCIENYGGNLMGNWTLSSLSDWFKNDFENRLHNLVYMGHVPESVLTDGTINEIYDHIP